MVMIMKFLIKTLTIYYYKFAIIFRNKTQLELFQEL